MGFVLSLVAGFISSACFYGLIRLREKNKFKEVLEDIDGAIYTHYELDGRPSRGNNSIIRYIEPNILHIKTCSPEVNHPWEGKVTMSELTPRIGTGYFEYLYPDKESWGTIRIHIKENDDILVHSVHKEKDNEASYIMKKNPKKQYIRS